MRLLVKLMQTYEWEWSVGYLWRWTNSLERLVLVVLALMLVRIIVIVASFFRSCRLARGVDTDRSTQRKLATELSLKQGSLRSIFATSPYLGLVGSCIGMPTVFRGYDGARFGLIVMVASGTGAALLSTAAGILVAVAATCSYNYLGTYIEPLEIGMSDGPLEKTKFPVRARFSTFSFAVVAAITLATSMLVLFPSYHLPQGLPVRLPKIGAPETEASVEPIVITVAASKTKDASDIYMNSGKTPWDELEGRLRSELRARSPHSVVYVQAENDVSWKDVLKAIDVAEGLHADVVLLTTTPNVGVPRRPIR